MTKTRSALTALLLIVAAICMLLSVSPNLKAFPANPPVYDTKQLPGSICRITVCGYQISSVSLLRDETMNNGAHQTVTPLNGTGSDPTATCDVVCPILRDRFPDSVGPRSAWVDVSVPPITAPGFPNINTTRGARCHLTDTTGVYTVQTSTGPYTKIWEQAGPDAFTPMPASVNIRRLNLGIPYPPTMPVPTEPWNAGATYANGYSAILCSMPIGSSIEGYGWQESAGESTDW